MDVYFVFNLPKVVVKYLPYLHKTSGILLMCFMDLYLLFSENPPTSISKNLDIILYCSYGFPNLKSYSSLWLHNSTCTRPQNKNTVLNTKACAWKVTKINNIVLYMPTINYASLILLHLNHLLFIGSTRKYINGFYFRVQSIRKRVILLTYMKFSVWGILMSRNMTCGNLGFPYCALCM